MKFKSLILLASCTLLHTCTSKKQVSKEKTSVETQKKEVRVDTLFKERIVEKEVIVRDTFFKESTRLDIVGKPTWDSLSGTWKPFVFDYTIFNSKGDSTRYKGSFTGEGSASYGADWETMYKDLMEKQKEQRKETSSSKEEISESEKFDTSKSEVLKEGYNLEMIIYAICGFSILSYCLGLFTPRLKNLIVNFIKSKLWFTKQK